MLSQLRTLARLTIESCRTFVYQAPPVGPFIAGLAFPLLVLRRRFVRLEAILLLLSLAFFALRSGFHLWDAIPSWDFEFFHRAGLALRDGADPYAMENFPLTYPPNSLPFFKFFAMFSFRTAARIWLAFNCLALVATLLLCRRVLRTDDAAEPRPLPMAMTACILVSNAAIFGLDAGQMCVWTVLWLYAALWCRIHGRPLLAGTFLALGAIKTATMLPFLLLFFRREDRLTWLALGIVGVALSLISSSPSDVIQRSKSVLHNIRVFQEPGRGNDYSFEGPYHDDIIGFNHWAYCLGMRDRKLIDALQVALTLALAALLFLDFYLRPIPGDAYVQYSLICVFSCLFLYHRMYDTIILAIPLLYCSDRAREQSGLRRASFVAAILGFLLVLNMPRGKPLHDLAEWSETAGLTGKLVQIVVLPYAVWVSLFAMIVIRFGARTDASARAIN